MCGFGMWICLLLGSCPRHVALRTARPTVGNVPSIVWGRVLGMMRLVWDSRSRPVALRTARLTVGDVPSMLTDPPSSLLICWNTTFIQHKSNLGLGFVLLLLNFGRAVKLDDESGWIFFVKILAASLPVQLFFFISTWLISCA